MPQKKWLNRKLSRVFKAAAVATTFSSSAGCLSTNVPSASLTTGEAALAHNIFGDTIDTSAVKKYFHNRHWSDVSACTPSKKEIHFFGSSNFSTDYSQDKSVYIFGNFTHEMTHVWQYQTYGTFHVWSGALNRSYNYKLSNDRDFTSYGVEQQGALVEDYARRFLHSEHRSFYITDTPETDAQLIKIVETQFPHTHEMRLEFNVKEAAAKVEAQRKAGEEMNFWVPADESFPGWVRPHNRPAPIPPIP